MNVTRSRTVLADHAEYTAARADVATLSGRGFPVEHLAIVGVDLQLREQIVGPASRLRRTASRAALGALIGLFFAAMALLADSDAVLAILAAVILGALLGALGGHVLARSHRGASYRIAAGRHQVLVNQDWADDARLLLDRKSHHEPAYASFAYREREIHMNTPTETRRSARGDGA